MKLTELLDIHKLREIFIYNPKEPMVFSSGLFLLLFLVFFGVYILIRKQKTLQVLYTALFSLFFYYKSSGFYFWVLILSTLIDYQIGNLLYRETRQNIRRLYLSFSLISNLGILCYFKYANFGIHNWNLLTGSDYSNLDIFLPVGISFYTFQTLSYSIDIYRRQLVPAKNILDFGFFVCFFPQLVAGPIVRAADFIPQIYKRLELTRADLGKAMILICGGLFKKVVISDYLSVNFVDRVFDNPLQYGAFENWLGVYGYAFQIYCDFSGYSDMAIGLSILMGFHLPDNFNSPYQSSSITEFWRRWHISLSSWLRDYLYIPLGGNRKGKIRTYINLLLTMLIGGLWHGASWKFVAWGGIHGSVLAIEKLFFRQFPPGQSQWRKVLGVILTFHIVCFAWIFFRASDFATSELIIRQMIGGGNEVPLQELFLSYKRIIGLIVLAFVLHFIPNTRIRRWMDYYGNLPLVVQALYVSISIWIAVQVAQADVLPFIYFQF
ncbi:MAG: MBOAT family protein [Bacteroidetes bacterium]|nr:MBOAT family protein [Bacteroidota bacterium]